MKGREGVVLAVVVRAGGGGWMGAIVLGRRVWFKLER